MMLFDLCRTFKRYHATAARLYALAWTAFPALADDLDQDRRYQAARSALLAAAGQGHDPGPLTGAGKKNLRVQARTWLEADVQQWTRWLTARDLKALPGLLNRQSEWQADP